jgi:arabinogalactan endo-1,4-beta-galactosidase
MNTNKVVYIILLSFLFMNALISQSIEVISFANNPVEVNPLVGGNITINYSYSSETGSAGNHMYIGLEILDGNNSYQSTVIGAFLSNQQAGINIQNSIELFIGSSNELTSDLPTGHYYQVKAILYASGGWEENAWAGHFNTPALILQDTSGFVFSTNSISKGADISWMTEMESNGFEWKDNAGNTKELMPLLKEYDLNAVRLRVWVNPENSGANGWCDIADLLAKAEKAKANNLEIMICIHYSDWWADPGQQTKPVAWSNYSVSQLETAVAGHTTAILTALSAEGITPKWVQIGNETNDGMLWTTGKASAGGFSNYAKFLNAGSNAVKSYNSAIKTILHIASGNDNALFRWNIEGLLNNGFIADRFDIIGMSLYPNETNWISMVEDTYDNMIDLKSRYNKEVMMVEIGFSNSRPDISHQFLTYLIEKTRQANGQGVFYWEPIAHGNFTSYSKGAWDQDGSPSIAMNAFINNSTLKTESLEIENNQLFSIFPNPSNQLITVKSSRDVLKSIKIYDITGKLIKNIDEAFQLSKTINISELQVGIYVLKINNSKSIKFLKH